VKSFDKWGLISDQSRPLDSDMKTLLSDVNVVRIPN
jgi:hypothetical protein